MRHKSLSAQRIALLFCLSLSPLSALAQTPVKEPFPFDWLRHDATPTNRPGGSTFYPPIESLDAQKRRQQIEPAMQEPQVMAAPAEAPADPASAADSDGRRVEAETTLQGVAPSPTARPTVRGAKTKPSPLMDEIEVVNKRAVMLNELKLVSLKDSRKPFVVRPSLKPGKSLTVEIPREWGCVFLVWTQFSEEPSEQYDGVDLCVDRKINLVD